MRLSVVIPAYNEENKIALDLRATSDFLGNQAFSSEILVVNDGSSDKTKERARQYLKRRLKQRKPIKRVSIRLLDYAENRGKGYAIRHGIEHARGDIIAFMDSGLCVPVRYLLCGMEKISEGYDYAIASRRLSGAQSEGPSPSTGSSGPRFFGWL